MNAESRPGQDISLTGQTETAQDISQKDTQTLREEFGNALRFIIDENFPSASAYARHTHEYQRSVSSWENGSRLPNPEKLRIILETLKPQGEELAALVNPWKEVYARSQENRIKTYAKTRKKATTPLGVWIDEVLELKGISQKELEKNINLAQTNISKWRVGSSQPDAQSISELLEYAQRENLPEDLKEKLGPILADIIINRPERFNWGPNRNITAQNSAACVTRTANQIANELNTSRQNIGDIRRSLGISHTLFTKEESRIIKKRYRKNKKKRPKNPRGVGFFKSRRSV